MSDDASLQILQIVRARVRHHVQCGCCYRRYSTPHALRRHIRDTSDSIHLQYRNLLHVLFDNHHPIPQGCSSDDWDPLALAHKHDDIVPLDSEVARIASRDDGIAPTTATENERAKSDLGVHSMLGNSVRNPVVLQALLETHLSLLEECSAEVRQLWESVGGLPRRVPSDGAYPSGVRISEQNVFITTLGASERRTRVFQNGIATDRLSQSRVKKDTLSLLAYQLTKKETADENSDSNESAACTISALIDWPNATFEVPANEGELVPEYIEDTEIVWATSGGFTDLHIDHGQNVISSPVGRCRKLFLLYPPTTQNLHAIEEYHTSVNRLADACHNMHGGVLVELSSQDLIIMHSGVLHAVWTQRGGFLLSRSYLDARSIINMSQWLAHCPSEVLNRNEKDRDVVVTNWTHAAELSTVATTLESWQTAKSVILRLLEGRKDEQRELLGFWQQSASRSDNNHQAALNSVIADCEAAFGTGKRPRSSR